ncbi:MAG: flagellar biosynthesis protein FlhF [Syntrophobacter sp.]
MQVKTFKAASMDRALAQVKKELGPDAIILSSRKIPPDSGDTGFEVTAALDPSPDPGAAASTAPSRAESESAEMQSDINEIKSFLSLLISSKDYFVQLQMQQPIAEIYHSLLVRGFDEKQIYMLLNKAASHLNGGTSDKNQVFDAFCKQFLTKVRLSKPFRNVAHSSGSCSIFTFIGPTGVGKTTTLAKMAAYLKIKRMLDVGIISVDTYRIGALDQLQTYANILEIPFCVAQSKTELDRAIQQFSHFDVILVDTTGRNFLNREHVHELQALFEGNHKPSHFLVLSSTAKDEDLRKTILHFKEMEIHSLIFTKLDETIHHGCMLNQLLRFDYPLSYMGTGQRVPEDLEQATQKRILSFLLPVRNKTA